MKESVRAALVAVLLLPPAAAPAIAETAYGAGDVLCNQYLKAARNSDILYHQASNWLLGYVSGMNAALRATKDAAAVVNLSNDDVLKSAWDYCASNPNSKISSVAEAWYGILPKQAEAPKAPEPPKRGGYFIDLERAPDRKPLLDRR